MIRLRTEAVPGLLVTMVIASMIQHTVAKTVEFRGAGLDLSQNRMGRSWTGEKARQLHPGVQGDARVPIGNPVE